MKNLLNALQEGRLIELPDIDKEKSLEYLAVIIEAIPDIGGRVDLVKEIKERESQSNTGIGMGIACPHARSRQEGELFCAIGWSPKGIDYGAPDGKKVHLVIMYYIPDNQKNTYLKEISSLAKAVTETGGMESLQKLTDINSLRILLLDWVELAIDKSTPDLKARMIKLEEKHTAAAASAADQTMKTKFDVFPFSVLLTDSNKSIVLSSNPEIIDAIEASRDAIKLLETGNNFDFSGYHISVLSTLTYPRNRVLHKCIAIKFK